MNRIIIWNDCTPGSIEKATKEKAKLEAEGYRLVSEKQIGLYKFRLEYTK